MKTTQKDLGVYVHIPYCLQRCSYCDFATYEQTKILPSQAYISLVREEIKLRNSEFEPRYLKTLYFGGGTPSLIAPNNIVAIKNELAMHGFYCDRKTEITIEINPATLTAHKLDFYLENGINRFSLGVQTFNENLLKKLGRKHNLADTISTIDLLKSMCKNYSLDLLFALPDQSIDDLKKDLEFIAKFQPPHLSPYCLTLPEKHPLNQNRPDEDHQILMFELIESAFHSLGLKRYEISNYAKPGYESKHNMLYWTDQEYWGLGSSAHSFSYKSQLYGMRFWNPNEIQNYQNQISNHVSLPNEQFELLDLHQSMTDFCHVSLRLEDGLPIDKLNAKFPSQAVTLIAKRIETLKSKGLIKNTSTSYKLTPKGRLLSNLVFSELTFLKDEISSD